MKYYIRRFTALLCSLILPCVVATYAAVPENEDVTSAGVPVANDELSGQFLLQTSYERQSLLDYDHFMTSRSRIVSFSRRGAELLMLERAPQSAAPRILSRIPIVAEGDGVLTLGFNEAFDRIFLEEDRTGEDYYGRVDHNDYSYFSLHNRQMRRFWRTGSTLVFEQQAVDDHGWQLVVHYYLRPYRENHGFEPFEMKNLDHFGLYESYPQQRDNRHVMYGSKFDVRRPVIFALSPDIPPALTEAVRDGVLYWNQAFGKPVLRVIDAPGEVSAPHPQYNVIEWASNDVGASTSHIQMDPLTAEILHAHIFINPVSEEPFSNADEYANHLRYVVAHEVGHALGLRHNFASGPVSTVMNYFGRDEAVRIGREVIAASGEALPYDRLVIRNVYLDQPTELGTLPAFCTDHQPHCRRPWLEFRAIDAAAAKPSIEPDEPLGER